MCVATNSWSRVLVEFIVTSFFSRIDTDYTWQILWKSVLVLFSLNSPILLEQWGNKNWTLLLAYIFVSQQVCVNIETVYKYLCYSSYDINNQDKERLNNEESPICYLLNIVIIHTLYIHYRYTLKTVMCTGLIK